MKTRHPFTHPIWSTEEAGQWEKELLGGDTEKTRVAMHAVGTRLASRLREDFAETGAWPERPRLLLLVGKGHNGGDALLAAAALARQSPGTEVVLLAPDPVSSWRPLTREAQDILLATLHETGGSWTHHQWPRRHSGTFTVVLDGLLGMSTRGPLRAPLPDLLAWVNADPAIRWRAAVDLPTGLMGEGETFRADATYATGLFKQPLLDPRAASRVGRLRYLDIGFCAPLPLSQGVGEAPELLVEACLDPLRQPCPAGHFKNRCGHLGIIGGSLRYPGAVLLTVEAALHAGAGLVTAFIPEPLVPAFAARCPGAIWRGVPVDPQTGWLSAEALDRLTKEADSSLSALVLGPGLDDAPEVGAAAARLAKAYGVPVLLDASALQPALLDILGGPDGPPLLLTPHRREMQRLLGKSSKEPLEDAFLRDWAREQGVILLLKGPPLTRLTDGHRLWLAIGGGPVLARGGSGDLLAGIAGARLAAASDQNPITLFEALAQAAYWHNRAAEKWAAGRSRLGTQITDILPYLAL